MSPLRIQLDRIRRRAWLVLAITVLAFAGALAAAAGQDTTYTGRSTLTIISQDRAPEQDAPLAQGYAEYFNELSYQRLLSAEAGVPVDVVFSARTAATSPIIYIEATTSSADGAASAAAAIAGAFLENVNANLLADRAGEVAALQDQILAERAVLAGLPESSPEVSLSTEVILALQERSNFLQTDTSNQLQELQLAAGVSESRPNLVQNGALGLLGGFVLGCVAALAFATVENRLATAHDVRDQLGLDTLAVIPGGRPNAAGRVQRLKQFANRVSLSDINGPVTIAVISARAGAGVAQVAEALAYYRAIQGERTLLMHADLHRERSDQHRGAAGVADFLAGPQGIGVEGRVLPGRSAMMQVMLPGRSPDDPYALFARDRFADLTAHATAVADLVVVAAPPIIEAAESQVICATADRTILVVEENSTRAADAVEACQLLEQVEATLLGVVIIRSRSGDVPSGLALAAAPIRERVPDQPTVAAAVDAGGEHGDA